MKYFFLFLFPLWIFASSPQIEKSIMYQPQEKDFLNPNWELQFKVLSQQGFKTVIIQWLSYGQHRFFEKHPAWIKKFLKYANQYDMKIIFGLYADPAYFQKIEKEKGSSEKYLQTLYEKNMHTAQIIYPQLFQDKAFEGWYIYDEINDENWQGKKRQKELKNYLQLLHHSLSSLAPNKKIMISAYFSGKTSPNDYAHMLTAILPDDWILLLQSGVGADLVNLEECQTYFNTFSKLYRREWMPIIELFSFFEDHPRADFLRFVEQQQCIRDNHILFSWRYFFDNEFIKLYKKEKVFEVH